ncbi:MAG: hypothetical protein DMG98_21935 [Acidobacteria bacterium]|nr:MAG: hypothetical protein DMG98_21935 [Acidobacteriota bacterium]
MTNILQSQSAIPNERHRNTRLEHLPLRWFLKSPLTCNSLTAGRTALWQMPQDQRKEDRDGYQSNWLDGMAGIVGGED